MIFSGAFDNAANLTYGQVKGEALTRLFEPFKIIVKNIAGLNSGLQGRRGDKLNAMIFGY